MKTKRMASPPSPSIHKLVYLLLIFGLFECIWGSTKCFKREQLSLIDFNKSFHHKDGKLSSWSSDGENCCSWTGISCDNFTGHVVSLNLSSQGLRSNHLRPSLLELRHLRVLDLSKNNFSMKIPEFIGSFDKLTALDLSNAGFFGMIPPHIGNLSHIQTLDLSSNELSSNNFEWLSRLTSLKSLNLSYVSFSAAWDWLYTLSKFPSLSSFRCSSCNLPSEQLNSSISLQTLDLSYNNISSSVVIKLIKDMVSLQKLDLSGNLLDGAIFKSIGNLCVLKELNVSNCRIPQTLGDTLKALTSCASGSLEVLDLSLNSLTGTIPTMLEFPLLVTLDMSLNHLDKFSPLEDSAGLGFFPPSLSSLFLSSNSLNGVLSDAYIANLRHLLYLDLSSNPNLTIDFNQPPFQLHLIDLRSCKLGTKFPSWVLTQKSYYILDMSDSTISGTIPPLFWTSMQPSIMYLNLSMNALHDMVPNFPFQFSYPSLIIDLSSNAFYGPIPFALFQASVLLLPKNRFSSFGNDSASASRFRVSILDLSDNYLSGMLPPWFELHKMRSVYMQSNRLSGMIPSPMGSPSCDLYLLSLCNNSFSGPLPQWLSKCTGLRILDMSTNNISGFVPSWIGDYLRNIVSITLQINNMQGSIPTSLCQLDSLQILDLSHNNLSRGIPSCVTNFTAMALDVNSSLEISASLDNDLGGMEVEKTFSYYAYISWKGLNQQFKKNLPLVKLIGLSNNRLSGRIPVGLTSLVGLKSLDLSSNKLYGSIPIQIGQLKSLELLNLSYNGLSGHIPTSLGDISSLGTLSLSHNNLSGRIPSSTQLEGFTSSCYEGNPQLCGFPLKHCSGDGDNAPPRPSATEDGSNVKDNSWTDEECLYAGMGSGFSVGFLAILGSLTFITKWRYAFFRFASKIADWILLVSALQISKVSRKIHR